MRPGRAWGQRGLVRGGGCVGEWIGLGDELDVRGEGGGGGTWVAAGAREP